MSSPQSSKKLARQILRSIASVPEGQKAEKVLEAVSDLIKNMPLSRLKRMSRDVSVLGDHELFTPVANLIDGQLALREISGTRRWR